MKKIFSFLFVFYISMSVFAQDKNANYFGEKITADNAMPATMINEQLAKKDTLAVKLTGKISMVCQKKGCWMMMETGNGMAMRVRFKDYEFFVPKDCAGKTAVIEGIAFNDVTSVAELKHYAEDANKSKEEIEKITQQEKRPAFEAKGVIIYE
jgi:hypothetical protein